MPTKHTHVSTITNLTASAPGRGGNGGRGGSVTLVAAEADAALLFLVEAKVEGGAPGKGGDAGRGGSGGTPGNGGRGYHTMRRSMRGGDGRRGNTGRQGMLLCATSWVCDQHLSVSTYPLTQVQAASMALLALLVLCSTPS